MQARVPKIEQVQELPAVLHSRIEIERSGQRVGHSQLDSRRPSRRGRQKHIANGAQRSVLSRRQFHVRSMPGASLPASRPLCSPHLCRQQFAVGWVKLGGSRADSYPLAERQRFARESMVVGREDAAVPKQILTLAIILDLALAAHGGALPQDIPAAIQAPADQQLYLQLHGQGHQIYVCKNESAQVVW